MSALSNALDAARAGAARVILPETGDERIIEATRVLQAEGFATPVALMNADDDMLEVILGLRPMKEAIARRLLDKPLYRAAAMVALGHADAMVAGATVPTRRVIEAASIAIGMADGITTPSSFFLMELADGREMIFADCAVTVAPDAAQLADIAVASARSATALIGEARVALLSFSTDRSGVGDSVEMVRAAAGISGFSGPVQADAALSPDVARRKGMGTGGANVLIFPSLDAGNIAYKLCVGLAGAKAYGPILQGFAKPVCDLSRSATVEDIVAATALTLALG